MEVGVDDKNEKNEADQSKRSKVRVSIPTKHDRSTCPTRSRLCRRIGFLANDILFI